MPWNKTDRSFKTLINKRVTDSDAKFYFNEKGDFTINTHQLEIWVDSIPTTAPGSTTDVVEYYNTLTLVEDTSVPNKQTWFATSNSDTVSAQTDEASRLKNWVSDKYGLTYEVVLYDSSDVQIPPSDGCGWFFDYQTGVLTFSSTATTTGAGGSLSSRAPFKIKGYRYIGRSGLDGNIIKNEVRVATTPATSFSGWSYSSELIDTGVTSTTLSIDDISLNAIAGLIGDRILIKNLSSSSNNGIYYVERVGDGASDTWRFRRAPDFNDTQDIFPGTMVFVRSGTVNSRTVWSMSNALFTTLDAVGVTGEITFAQFVTATTRWSALTVPDANLSLAMSTYTTAFNWPTGTSSNNLFSLTTDSSSNGTGVLLNVATGASSTVVPLRVRRGSSDYLTVSADGSVLVGALTSGRVTYAGTNGLLQDSSNMTFNGSRVSLATTGSSGGLLIGGDANLYRSGADVLATDDHFNLATVNREIRFNTSDGNAGGLLFNSNMRFAASPNDGFWIAPQNNYTHTSGVRNSLAIDGGFVPLTTSSGSLKGLNISVFYADSDSGSVDFTGEIIGVDSSVLVDGHQIGSHTFNRVAAIQGNVLISDNNSGSGGITTNAYAGWFTVSDNATDASVTNTYGLYVSVDTPYMANAQSRYGLYIDAMPDPGAYTSTVTTAIRLAGTGGARDGILFGFDSNLYRSTTDTLRTDDSLIVGVNLTVNSLTSGRVPFASTSGLLIDSAALTFATGTGQLALSTTGSGAGLLIGGDTQIYRSSANVLRTPDSFTIDGDLITLGAASVGNVGGTTGTINLIGSTSGTVSIKVKPNAGTYNFNLPISAGTAGQVLTSDGGTSNEMYWTTAGLLPVRWNSLVDPPGSLSLSMSIHPTTFNWNTGTSTDNLFNLTVDGGSDGTGALLRLATGISATVLPLLVVAGGTTALTVNASAQVLVGALTSGRVVYAGTNGLLQDSSNMTFDGNRLVLSTTGSSGGLLIGGDVNLYRLSSNVLRTDDSLVVAGNIDILNAGRMSFYESGSGNFSSFVAGSQSVDINYTLPASQPTTNQVLSATAVSGSGPYDVTLGWTTDSGDTSVGSTVSGGTTGSVLFVGGGSALSQDNSNLFWDDTNNFLGIGASATPGARLHLAGNQTSSAWGLAGLLLQIGASTLTDSSSSGTVASVVVNSLAQSTLAASSSTTFTSAATLYISNAPFAGSNVVITNGYALWVDNGIVRLDGNTEVRTLTSGRVTYAGTNGLLQDSANITFDGNQLVLATTGSSGGLLIGGDVNIYRSSANVLATDDSLVVGVNLTVNSLTSGRVPFASTSGLLIDSAAFAFTTGTGQLALSTTGSGAGILIGGDANLYRSSANVLATDDSLIVGVNLTVSSLTSGSILFTGASGLISQNNSNFYWDNVNNTLGIGSTRTGAISSTNPTFRIASSGDTSSTSSFEIKNTISDSLFFVRDDARVGILTNAPTACFHVNSSIDQIALFERSGDSVLSVTSDVTLHNGQIGCILTAVGYETGGLQINGESGVSLNTTSTGTISVWNDNSIRAEFTNSYLALYPHGTSSGNTYELQFFELNASGNEYLSFKAPDAFGTSITHILPADVPSAGEVLKIASYSGGTATLEWSDAGTTIGGTVSSGTTGSVLFVGASSALTQDNSNFYWDDTNNTLGIGTTRSGAISGTNPSVRILGTGASSSTSSFEVQDSSANTLLFVRNDGRVSIGVNSPTYDLSIGGQTARTIGVERKTTGTGSSLTIQSGGAQSGGSNLAAGNLIISSGSATGNAAGYVDIHAVNNQGASSGTADNSAVLHARFGSGKIGFGTSTLTYDITVASLYSAAPYNYTIGMLDSTAVSGHSLQINAGHVLTTADLNGGNITLTAGNSTGSGSSNIVFQTASAGSPGTTVRTSSTQMTLTGAGQLQISTTGSGAGLLIGGDANLYRSSANVLTTDDSLVVGVNLTVNSLTSGRVPFASTSGLLIDSTAFAFATGTGQLALSTTGSGAGILIGGDTQLYRSSANVLRTPDSFTIDADLVTLGANSVGNVGGTTGTINLIGSTSGTVSVLVQAAAGTYNFNLPTTAGTSSHVLTSAGGAGSPMTWTDPASLAVRWNSLTNPNGNESLSMSTNTTVFNWTTGTSTNNLFSLTTDALADGTGVLLNIATGASSTVVPFRVRRDATDYLTVNATGGVLVGNLTSTRITYAGASGLLQDSANMTFDGNRIALATTGNTGGLLIGGDVNLYRSSANVLATDDSLIVSANLTVSTMTSGSVWFAGTSGLLSQSNSNFFWDNTNTTLGIGTTRTGAISATNPRVRIRGNGSASTSSSFEVQDSGTGPILFVRNDGRVGIGTNAPASKLNIAGNLATAAWTTNGAGFSISASNFTDNTTATSGTVTNSGVHAIARPTIIATNTGVIYTNAATFYIANAPANGANVTITNPYALWIAAGLTRLDGGLNVTGAITGTTSLTLGVASSSTGSIILRGVTSGTVTVQSAAAAGTWTLTLPTTAGTSGQYLQTNGSGVSSWQTVVTGTSWSVVSGTSQTAVSNGGYISNNASLVTITLPTPTVGSIVEINGLGAGGWKAQCASGHTIRLGNVISASSGSANSTNQYDTVKILGISSTQWHIISSIGTIDIV